MATQVSFKRKGLAKTVGMRKESKESLTVDGGATDERMSGKNIGVINVVHIDSRSNSHEENSRPASAHSVDS